MSEARATGLRSAEELPAALESWPRIGARLAGRRPAMFLDYDGTLTPIVSQPEDALLSPPMRDVLARLSRFCTVAIVSGRDRADVEALVELDGIVYAGSHGFDIRGPGGLRLEHERGRALLPELDAAEEELRSRIEPILGARVERKRFAIANHYRNVAERDVPRVEAAVKEVQAKHPRLRISGGKKVFELRPDIDWDKGRAVLWLLAALDLDRSEVVPFYLGDDVTDEDAFRALRDRGVAIVVGDPPYVTSASYRLKDTTEVQSFLAGMVNLLEGRRR